MDGLVATFMAIYQGYLAIVLPDIDFFSCGVLAVVYSMGVVVLVWCGKLLSRFFVRPYVYHNL